MYCTAFGKRGLEPILYFLHRFSEMDYTDEDCRKQLIKIFVNSVFVYDDKVVITFNYSRDDRTITLKEIDAGLQQGVRLPRLLSHQVGVLIGNSWRSLEKPGSQRNGKKKIHALPHGYILIFNALLDRMKSRRESLRRA